MPKINRRNSFIVIQNKNVYGTYVHGIFDRADIASVIIKALAQKNNIDFEKCNLELMKGYKEIKEEEFDRLADTLRKHMDIEKIYSILK